MKNVIKILFIFLILGCSSENEPSNDFGVTNISPLTARIGDTLIVTGNNVNRLTLLYFKNNQNDSQSYTENAGQIIFPDMTSYQKSFYFIPNIHSEKAIIGKGSLKGGQGDKDNFQFNFNTVGFFQIKTGMPFDDLPFFSQYQLQTVNDNLAFVLVNGQIYKSSNGYYKWKHISTINLNNIENYFFLDENNGWFFTYEDQKINMYYTQDGGESLSLGFSEDYNVFRGSVSNVKFINPNFGLFSISGKVFFTDNNGYKDIYEYYPDLNNLPFGNINLSDFTILNENLVYLNSSGDINVLIKVENSIASYNDDFDSVPIGSTHFFGSTAYQQINNSIFKTIDNGASWNKIKTFDDFFPSIHFIDSQIGLVFSDYETQVVYKTIDGGTTWFEYFSPEEYKHKSELTTSNKNYSWLFNIRGKLYKYIEE